MKRHEGLFDNKIKIREYEIQTHKLKAGDSVKIALVSDLHSNPFDIENNKISQAVKEQKPDIIALAGDIADSLKGIKGAVLFVREISEIAPVYYVTGNHECREHQYGEITEALSFMDAVVLKGEYRKVTVNGVEIIIGGVDDPNAALYITPGIDWEKDLVEGFAELNNMPQYKILLSHRPELVEVYKKTPFDMILSGHSHGGQVRIPGILNGLYAPQQGIFPKYAGGLYEYSGKTHIVSRGASYAPRPRIFNPPELVFISLIG